MGDWERLRSVVANEVHVKVRDGNARVWVSK